MNTDLFRQRMHAAGLSQWELGDLLGVHPHDIHDAGRPGAMAEQPVKVIAELAQRLDLHPADIADVLEPALSHRREPVANSAGTGADALVLLTALATTSVPLSTEELAEALTWDLERVTAAIQHAADHPGIGGPIGLRWIPPHAWTVTARLDVLTPEQRNGINDRTRYREPLTPEEASVLLAATYSLRAHGEYRNWVQDHRDAEHALKTTGLLHSDRGPHHVDVHPDVRYSLDRDTHS